VTKKKLFSQGMVRPGIVQEPFWAPEGWPTVPTCWDAHDHLDVTTHDSPGPVFVCALLSPRPTPRSHADPRLSNRIER
jgi:hypothetical protein